MHYDGRTGLLPPDNPAAADPAEASALVELDDRAWRMQYVDPRRAEALGQRLVAGTSVARWQALGRCHVAFAQLRSGQDTAGRASLDQAWRDALRDGGAQALARCRDVLALVRRRERRLDDALALLRENLALPAGERLAHERCVTHNLLGLTCSGLGRLDDALRHYLLARDEAHTSQDAALQANAVANLSGLQADLLNLGDAVSLADEALASADAAGLTGSPVWLTAAYNRVFAALSIGDDDASLSMAHRMQFFAAAVPAAKRARYALLWATVAARNGQLHEAARWLARAPDADLLLERSVVQAMLANRAGRHAEARAACDAARECLVSGGEEALPQDRMRLFEQGAAACEALGDAVAALDYARRAFAQYELLAGRAARARRITAEVQLSLELERRSREEAVRRRDAAEQEQRRLATLNDALRAANAAKSRFLAAASHDLRQPLHALGLQAANLCAALSGHPEAGSAQRMARSVASLAGMFDALLDISQIEAGGLQPRPVPTPLRPLLLRLAEELQPLAEARGLRLALRLPARGAGAQADTDAALLETVLRNLLSNAIKYTESGGVMLALRRRHRAPGGWWLQVLDTGIGIAAADQQRVFDDFVQLANPSRRRSHGLGLGLSIVRRLTAALGHDLRLASTPGRGTCVTVVLGAAAASVSPDAGAAEVRPGPLAPGPGWPGRVVAIVEDDHGQRQALRALLQAWRLTVVAARGWPDLADALASLGRPPDALITDLHLADGDHGTGLAQRLRRRDPALPVLVLSGSLPPASERQADLDWMAKPASAEALAQWLQRALPAPAA